MSLGDLDVDHIYSANGITTDFAIQHAIIDDDSAETLVYLVDESVIPAVETLQVEGADYDLTGASFPTTPFNTTVSFGIAPTTGLKVLVRRALPLTQPTEFDPNGRYPAQASELALDRLAAEIQLVNEAVQRALKFRISSSLVDLLIADPVAHKTLRWNANADAMENHVYPSLEDEDLPVISNSLTSFYDSTGTRLIDSDIIIGGRTNLSGINNLTMGGTLQLTSMDPNIVLGTDAFGNVVPTAVTVPSLGTLLTDMAQAQADIIALFAADSVMGADIVNLQGDVLTLQNQMTALDARVTVIENLTAGEVSNITPGISTADALVVWNDTGGAFVKNSSILITDVAQALTDISNLLADEHVALTLSAVGVAPNANGATLTGQVLNLEPADGTHPGVVTELSQTFGGDKTFVGNISANNLSGTNTGDLTLSAFSSTPSTEGLTLVAQVLNLDPADDTHPGGVSILEQTFAGEKELLDGLALGPQDIASSATINAMDSSKSFVRITGSTATALNGIAAPASGKSKLVIIYNASSVDVTIANNSGAASAGDKILTSTGAATVLAAGSSVALIYDQTQTAWVFAASVGSSATPSGGGSMGSINWIEDDVSPATTINYHMRLWSFEATLGQQLYTLFKVPSSYVAGDQINLTSLFYSDDTSGDVYFRTLTTLIKTGIDAIDTDDNQRTSSQGAVTLSGGTVHIPQSITCDLTAADGTINSVAVAAGDMLLIKFFRYDSDTATGPAYLFPEQSEVA